MLYVLLLENVREVMLRNKVVFAIPCKSMMIMFGFSDDLSFKVKDRTYVS